MKIGIIGVGEVGSAYAKSLAGALPGAQAVTGLQICDREGGGRPGATAAELNLELHPAPGPWLQDCEMVVAAVAGADSLVAAAQALPHLGEASVYVDIGTASPDDLRASAAAFDAAGRSFIDGAIMGAIAISGARCPVLLAGPAADAVVPIFDTMGAPSTVLPESAAGDASSLKLLRSVIIKGLECVAIESLTAAEHLGVRGRLMEVIRDVDAAGFGPFIEALVRTHVDHAKRRGHEMEDAAAQLKDLGFDALVTQATPGRYTATEGLRQIKPPPEGAGQSIEQALAWLASTVRGSH